MRESEFWDPGRAAELRSGEFLINHQMFSNTR